MFFFFFGVVKKRFVFFLLLFDCWIRKIKITITESVIGIQTEQLKETLWIITNLWKSIDDTFYTGEKTSRLSTLFHDTV